MCCSWAKEAVGDFADTTLVQIASFEKWGPAIAAAKQAPDQCEHTLGNVLQLLTHDIKKVVEDMMKLIEKEKRGYTPDEYEMLEDIIMNNPLQAFLFDSSSKQAVKMPPVDFGLDSSECVDASQQGNQRHHLGRSAPLQLIMIKYRHNLWENL